MHDSFATPARRYTPGIGDAVADRTINRTLRSPLAEPFPVSFILPRQDDTSLNAEVSAYARREGMEFDGYTVQHGDDQTVEVTLNVVATVRKETWADVAHRVAVGSSLLRPEDAEFEYHAMHHHLRQASILMSGRHLQHGDDTQPSRPQEVFTNCLDGSEKILTQEYGPVSLEKITGQTVHVVAGDGEIRPAFIHNHGVQALQRVTFRTVKGGGGKFRNHVKATPNHRWILRDGTVTTELSVGDVIQANPDTLGAMDPEGVVHGLIFGDGTAHKSRNDFYRTGVSQGRTYASLRVCAKDVVQDTIHTIMDDAGYPFTQPPHANGDRVYYLGKVAHAKELPHTRDPEYIKGFLYGWWLADGSKSQFQGTEISTADEKAAAWLEENVGYAGYTITMHRTLERTLTDGSYANGKALHCLRMRKGVEWKVDAIEAIDPAPVYCPEEPVTQAFVLANGLLTGNCSTSAASFLTFYLLLNGSGVGRAYDNAMMMIDYSQMPIVVPVIDMMHPDSLSGEIKVMDPRSAKHLYRGSPTQTFMVPDSREGWAKAIEVIDLMTFQGLTDNVLLLDFSEVRCKGSPIQGMQDRPASGPGPVMDAISKMARLRGCNMALWRQAMYADHYLAECVLVGGARRAARMATKTWRDLDVVDFVHIKRPLEYLGLDPQGILDYQKEHGQPMGFLWSSNNSVTVDEEFWELVKMSPDQAMEMPTDRYYLWRHANEVLNAIAEASYYDGTGEPGIINQERLTQIDEGFAEYADGEYAGSQRYQLENDTKALMKQLALAAINSPFKMITNPCGEITLVMLGAYCVIADVVPYHAGTKHKVQIQLGNYRGWDVDAIDAFRTATRALIRTNLMDCLYRREVNRTNRIGVGMTGLHEYAYARFGYSWHDLVDEQKSLPFWLMLSTFKRAVQDEAQQYAQELGVAVPHTDTTMKPAGTTSKLFGLTEGAHLPSMKEYLRWVQFRHDDPLVNEYRELGYPVRELRSYSGTTIVGFPTRPEICSLGMGDRLVTAAEATPEEQYQYLRLLEKYWIRGVAEDGITPLRETGNQVSYTLKYLPDQVSFEDFRQTLIAGQSTIRCCSVMPQDEGTAYEYQPEQPLPKGEYEKIVAALKSQDAKEDVAFEHIDCGSGGCPIDFKS